MTENKYFYESEIFTRSKGEKKDEYIAYGIAIVYEKEAEIFPKYFETIKLGSAANALKSDEIMMLRNHNKSDIVARVDNGTLRLFESNDGVHFEVDLSKSERARNLHEEIQNGLIRKMSFGFTVTVSKQQNVNRNGLSVSTNDITEIGRIFEISAVTTPAYSDTSVGARSVRQRCEIDESFLLLQKLKTRGVKK